MRSHASLIQDLKLMKLIVNLHKKVIEHFLYITCMSFYRQISIKCYSMHPCILIYVFYGQKLFGNVGASKMIVDDL
jgi:hypothetical protein